MNFLQVKCLSEYCNITLSNRLQSSKYQVKIRAYNKAGFGKYSKIITFTTETSKSKIIQYKSCYSCTFKNYKLKKITLIFCKTNISLYFTNKLAF